EIGVESATVGDHEDLGPPAAPQALHQHVGAGALHAGDEDDLAVPRTLRSNLPPQPLPRLLYPEKRQAAELLGYVSHSRGRWALMGTRRRTPPRHPCSIRIASHLGSRACSPPWNAYPTP